MNKTHALIGITLEGFQVFDKPTYIPLDRLTLMFGPNSAGKSAVMDALELCEELRKTEYRSFNMIEGKARELMVRHWRQSVGGGNSTADQMSIAVKYRLDDNFDSLNGRIDHGDQKAYYEAPIILESRWTFKRKGDEDNIPYFGSFDFLIQSELLVRNECIASKDGFFYKFAVNISHPLIKQIELKSNFDAISKQYASEVSFANGIFSISRGVSGFQWCGLGIEEKRQRWLHYYPPHDKINIINYDLLESAVSELGDVIGNILFLCYEYADFKPQKVDASRTVPSRADLVFKLGSAPGNSINLDLSRIFLPNGNPVFISLAASLAGLAPACLNKEKYAERINSSLSDHLFLEQGYQIDYDYRLLMSRANSVAVRNVLDNIEYQEEDDGVEIVRMVRLNLNFNDVGYLVELFLRDGNGRRLMFEDVGSGIGYVLPVLCAIHDPEGGACFIQQPELHLHPALQAAIGDVFIEASNAGKQILTETHSEHLLLRILKRIRQTHLQASIAPELKISADDVCVLYFDPSPSGTTSVKRLRITEDGEFMDRWPRGFFGERDQELLDE